MHFKRRNQISYVHSYSYRTIYFESNLGCYFHNFINKLVRPDLLLQGAYHPPLYHVDCSIERHSVQKCKIGSCIKSKSRHNTLLHTDIKQTQSNETQSLAGTSINALSSADNSSNSSVTQPT